MTEIACRGQHQEYLSTSTSAERNGVALLHPCYRAPSFDRKFIPSQEVEPSIGRAFALSERVLAEGATEGDVGVLSNRYGPLMTVSDKKTISVELQQSDLSLV